MSFVLDKLCCAHTSYYKYWFKCWKMKENYIFQTDHLEECVLFGFTEENKISNVISLCNLITKYYKK